MIKKPTKHIFETISVSEYLNLFKNRGSIEKFSLFKATRALTFLERMLGERIYLEWPSHLGELGDVDPHFIEVSSALQKAGLVGKLEISKKTADEPELFRVRSLQGGGADFSSITRALWKATAETAERTLWRDSDYVWKKGAIDGSINTLKNKNHLDIYTLVGFSDEQKRKHKNLYFDEETEFKWIPARSLSRKNSTLIPAQLASAHYWRTEGSKKEPMLRWTITTGLATGQTIEEAVFRGILEVIERDAFMITYLNMLSPTVLDNEYLSKSDEDIREILGRFKKYNLTVKLLKLITDIPVTVIGAVILDSSKKGPAFVIGAKADTNLKEAVLGALSEALSVRYAFKHKWKDPVNLKKINREERVAYWFDMEKSKKIEFLTSGKIVQETVDQKKNIYAKNIVGENYKEKLQSLVALFKDTHEIFYVDLTNPEMKRLNIYSVFVIIPDFQPMHLDESIPYLGGARLKSVPESQGYKSAKPLNPEPHPFP